MQPEPIVNKVAQKALITLDLGDYFPRESEVMVIDIKAFLYKELLLKEAEFRKAVDELDKEPYRHKYVAIYCSNHAIVPMWAYMLLAAELAGIAKDIACTQPAHAPEVFLYRNLTALDMSIYQDQRVVVKGCGDRQVPEAAFVQITKQLAPVARVIMYGEPCSSVPVYKRVLK